MTLTGQLVGHELGLDARACGSTERPEEDLVGEIVKGNDDDGGDTGVCGDGGRQTGTLYLDCGVPCGMCGMRGVPVGC